MALNLANKFGDHKILLQQITTIQYHTSIMLNAYLYYSCINILVMCYLLQTFVDFWHTLFYRNGAVSGIYEKSEYREYGTVRTGTNTIEKDVQFCVCSRKNYLLNQLVTGVISLRYLISFDYSNSKLILRCYQFLILL